MNGLERVGLLCLTSAAVVPACMAQDGLGQVGVTSSPLTNERKRVEICHKGETIFVGEAAVTAHLAHGDELGSCPSTCTPSSCDDGNLCTSDACDARGVCQHVSVACDDGNACTFDSCDPSIGCITLPSGPIPCNDGNACTGSDFCEAGRCKGAAIPGCCNSDDDCSDGDACTLDRCISGTCSGVPIDCRVADKCAAGFCDPTVGACDTSPVSCDDSDPCTADSCDASLGCVHSPVADCGGAFGSSILVAPEGADMDACGLNREAPCKTIEYAIGRGITEGRFQILLRAGVYPGVLHLREGFRIAGGYGADWTLGSHADPAHRATLIGGRDPETAQYMTVAAHSLTEETALGNLEIAGPDAPINAATASSYAVHAVSANLHLEDVRILGGNGAPGASGSAGMSASVSPAAPGVSGSAGMEIFALCDDSRAIGGSAGVNSCAGRSTAGGFGGPGGQTDTSCATSPTNPFGDLTASEGRSGASAAFVFGPFGTAGSGGALCVGTSPGDGAPGVETHGTGGRGAMDPRGRLAGNFWLPAFGTSGALGDNGGGGGGGGGAGGCDNPDARGASGGGGGAGGCRAPFAGVGGSGGGGSFGLFAIDSRIDLANVVVIRGLGGNGGPGGNGGVGQPGGIGGIGGHGTVGTHPGGAGGRGGVGGHSGAGGGGVGGMSVGVFRLGGSLNEVTTVYTGGAAGSGGPGGANPARAESSGGPGDNGILSSVFECFAAGSC